MIRFYLTLYSLLLGLCSLSGQVIEHWNPNFELDQPLFLEWRSGFHAQDSLAFIEQDSGWVLYNPLSNEAEFITTKDPITGNKLAPIWSLWLNNRVWFLANHQIYFYQEGKTYRGDSLWPGQNFTEVNYLFSDDQRLLFVADSKLWIWDQDSLGSIHIPWDVGQEKTYKAFHAAHASVYALSRGNLYLLEKDQWKSFSLPQGTSVGNTYTNLFISHSEALYLSLGFVGSYRFSPQAGFVKLTDAIFQDFKEDRSQNLYGLNREEELVRIEAGKLDTLEGYKLYSMRQYFRGASNLFYGLKDYNGLITLRLDALHNPRSTAILNNGIWQAGLSSSGGLFDQSYGPYGEEQRAEDPLNFQSVAEGNHLVTDAGLWLSYRIEVDSGTKTYFDGTALKSRVFNDAGDINFGPISFKRDEHFRQRYNRVWKVDQAMIRDFRRNYEDPFYPIPEVIQNWPAHGDTTKGEAWLLAPFVDLNYNDIYEPHKGDYPSIKGEAALLAIFNNARRSNESEISGILGLPDSLLIEGLIMLYHLPKNGIASDSAVFVEYKITNRGRRLEELHIGMEARLHNKSSGDRLRACDSINNNAFIYPMNPYNGAWQSAFVSVPDQQMISHTVVHSPEETSSIAYQPRNHFPMGADHFYNYLNSYFCWGKKQVRRPTEIQNDSLSGVPTASKYPLSKFQFNAYYNWKALQGRYPFGQNRSSLLRHPNVNLETNESLCLTYAFHFSSSTKSWQQSVLGGQAQSQEIGDYLDAQDSCWTQILRGNQLEPQSFLISLWPNPSASVLQIQLDPENKLLSSRIYSINGSLVASYGALKSLDIHQLKAGLYLIECETEEGSALLKFIKL